MQLPGRVQRPGRFFAAPLGRPRLILLTLCLAVLITQLDTSVVNLAMKAIGARFHAGVEVLQWVMDAYNLVYASFLLTGGTLGDLFGRRRVFMLGIAIFTFGSLACGLAPSEAALIAGRAVTGIGAALLVPTSLAILAVAFPDAAVRARAIGIWASCNGLAFALGPTVGGLLVEAYGWRSIFLLSVPVSGLALVLAWRSLPESASAEGRHLDLSGQSLAITALGALTLAAIEGTRWGWLSRPTLLATLIGLLAGAAFLAVERRSPGALVPLGLLRRGRLATAMAVAGLMTFGMYAMLFLMPLYFQTVQRMSVFAAGLAMLPISLVFLVVSQASGRLVNRFGPRLLMTAGMGAMGLGLLGLARLTPESGLLIAEIPLAVIGVGLGLNTGPVMGVAVASVAAARSGTASGLVNTARMVGATLGIAILGALFAARAQGGDVAGFLAGLKAAVTVGGLGELIGAVLAFAFVRGDSLRPAVAECGDRR